MAKDYVASFSEVKASDALHFGVKGMHWGVRKSRSGGGSSGSAKPTHARKKEDAAKAKAKVGAAHDARIEKLKAGTGRPLIVNGKKLSTKESIDHLEKQKKKLGLKPLKKVEAKPTDVIKKDESPNDTYARLKAKAKKDGPNSLTDDELKYLNGRSEALSKAQKLVADPESWLSKTVKSTFQSVLQDTMKNVATTAATAFVADRANTKIKTAAKTKSGTGTATTSKGHILPVPFKVTTL
jgi:hypothetical protein